MFVGVCAADRFKGASRILLLHLIPLLLWEEMCSSEVNCKLNKYLGLGLFLPFCPDASAACQMVLTFGSFSQI